MTSPGALLQGRAPANLLTIGIQHMADGIFVMLTVSAHGDHAKDMFLRQLGRSWTVSIRLVIRSALGPGGHQGIQTSGHRLVVEILVVRDRKPLLGAKNKTKEQSWNFLGTLFNCV